MNTKNQSMRHLNVISHCPLCGSEDVELISSLKSKGVKLHPNMRAPMYDEYHTCNVCFKIFKLAH
jgi:hypothetical protein